MKKLCLAILMILLFAGMAHSGQFLWDPSDGATGYIMYFTDGTNNYNKNVGNATTCDSQIDLQMIPGDEYTVYVTAYNDYGESDPSNQVVYTETVYTPPDDNLPAVGSIPIEINNLREL